jgi:hypothetical protein
MARRDIAGLLTGVPSNFAETMIRSGQIAGDIQGGRLRGMLSGGKQSYLSPREQTNRGLRNFDKLDLKEKRDLIGRLQASGQTSLAGQLAAQLEEGRESRLIQDRKEALLKVAREQGNELIEEYILSAGDTDAALNKIQEVLFRRDPTFKTSGAPTKADITLYEKLLEQYTDKELKTLGIPTGFSFLGFGGGVDEADKLIIINNAKEIATNFPKLGKKAALAEALRQYGISKSAENMPTDTNVVESSSRMTGAKIK